MMQLDPSSSSISTPTNPILSEQPLQLEVITYMDNDLFKAAENGDIELFNKYQGDLHCLVDGKQNTALHIHSRTGRRLEVKIFEWLLSFQKKIFESEFFYDVVAQLMNKYPSELLEPNAKGEISSNFVKQLIDKCPSLLLQPNAKGEIPLHVAAKHGNFNMVKFLMVRAKVVPQEDLEKGSEATTLKQMLRMTDNDGNTAMHKAVESGDLDIMQLLMKELDPDFSFSANTSGETPLYIAAKRGRNNRLVAEILANWKSTDYGGPQGRTPLHAAVVARDEKTVRILIDANKRLTKEIDNKGWSPLHYAALDNCRSIVKLLLESDASAAYITDKERGMTALHLAAWRGDFRTMEVIISYCPGCCEIVDKRGWNFLHFTVVTVDLRILPVVLRVFERKMKYLPTRNLLDEKDVDGNRPSDILIFGTPLKDCFLYAQLVELFNLYGPENLRYTFLSSQTKKKQIRKLLTDRANDEEIAELPIYVFRKIVKVLDHEGEGTPKHEIKEKALESNLVVPALIATVTFAAAFTVPGGYRSDEQGTATLIRDSAFRAFIITNTLAFVFSLLAIFLHFWFSKLSEKQQKRLSRWNLSADALTIYAMYAMVVAFSTGTYAVLQSSSGFAIAALSIGLAFFPGIYFLRK